MQTLVDFLNGILWSNALIVLCLTAGIYFTVRSRFLQVRHFKEMLRLLLCGKSSQAGVSSFQAFAMTISARVGTGNIAGVAAAIAMGGPGAVFWMWVIAFFGSSSAYVESSLAQLYKEEKNGTFWGGPAFYIQKGLGLKWLAVIFSVAAIASMGFLLPGIQTNTMAAGFKIAFGVPEWATGLFVTTLLAVIIFGGVKRIARAAEIMVPVMAAIYLIMAVLIIAVNITKVPAVFSLIISSAFGAHSLFGGILGTAISFGVKRGIYSNESGMGTGAFAAAAAQTSHPAEQGFVQAFSVYVDTLLICTATALMILLTGSYNVTNPAGGFLVENLQGINYGSAYTQIAVDTLFNGFGSSFVAIALFFFSFTTVLASMYQSESSMSYITTNKKVMTVLKTIMILVVFTGSIRETGLAWALGDIGIALMAWQNIIIIFFLQKPAFAMLKDYELFLRERKINPSAKPRFNPRAYGIKNAAYWENQHDKK